MIHPHTPLQDTPLHELRSIEKVGERCFLAFLQPVFWSVLVVVLLNHVEGVSRAGLVRLVDSALVDYVAVQNYAGSCKYNILKLYNQINRTNI